MDSLRKLIGKKIRAIRKEKGLTQEKLAEKAQLSYQYIGSVERGVRNITIDSLAGIISALDVDFSQILNLTEVTAIPISEDENDKDYLLALINIVLKQRSAQEIKAIHNINKEIIKILPNNKSD